MNRMLLVESSKRKTMKGLLSFMVSGMLMGMISMVVLAAAVVPVSSTLSAARCDTWWLEKVVYQHAMQNPACFAERFYAYS